MINVKDLRKFHCIWDDRIWLSLLSSDMVSFFKIYFLSCTSQIILCQRRLITVFQLWNNKCKCGKMNISSSDMDVWCNVCRICATHNDCLIPIFKDEGLEQELSSVISKYCPFKVWNNFIISLFYCNFMNLLLVFYSIK